jgi:hypothetical protein
MTFNLPANTVALGDGAGEIEAVGWKEADMEARRKGDRVKLKLALRLQAETTMTVKWIASGCGWELGRMLITVILASARKSEMTMQKYYDTRNRPFTYVN